MDHERLAHSGSSRAFRGQWPSHGLPEDYYPAGTWVPERTEHGPGSFPLVLGQWPRAATSRTRPGHRLTRKKGMATCAPKPWSPPAHGGLSPTAQPLLLHGAVPWVSLQPVSPAPSPRLWPLLSKHSGLCIVFGITCHNCSYITQHATAHPRPVPPAGQEALCGKGPSVSLSGTGPGPLWSL